MKIKTNNQPREVLSWYDLTPAEQKEFDLEDGEGSFFRYKNRVYHMEEFMRVDHTAIPGDWHYYASDSYFSGLLVRYTSNYKSVIVGNYYL